MRHWLMKSEPEDFSIDDLARVGREPWSGVRNYQARNYMMKDMRVGDGVLFYHSNTDEPGVAGLGEVASEAYPDTTQFKKKSPYFDPGSKPEEPRWWLVDVGFVRKFDHVVTLAQLKDDADKLGDFPLLQRGTRLSVLPVTPAQWRRILSLAEKH
jgi:predicted RNA-binding protein with PUA-like domain